LVVEGSFSNHTYRLEDDRAVPGHAKLISMGVLHSAVGALVIEQKGVIHRVKANERSISLHIYVGPLDGMKLYESEIAFVSP
jgi:hypothetical protein